MEEELRVKKIREGTVIDHIAAGNALAVLKILGLTGSGDNVVSIVMNVPSKKLTYKDKDAEELIKVFCKHTRKDLQ